MEQLNMDNIKVTRDQALELMVYHLQMAHFCYQNTDNDHEACKAETRRLFEEQLHSVKRWKDDGGIGAAEEVKVYHDSPEIVAGMAWLERMHEIYEEMRKEDE